MPENRPTGGIEMSTKTPHEISGPVRGIGLVIFIVVCLGAGGLGAIATRPEIPTWYPELVKPLWNPPAYLFGPVWTTLFVMMAVAGWLVWKLRGFTQACIPLTLFGLQLLLNVAWSWIFFGYHQPGWAFVEIILLWLAILATTVAFFRSDKTAGWLMIPYLAWVTFASVLNFTIWRLNTP